MGPQRSTSRHGGINSHSAGGCAITVALAYVSCIRNNYAGSRANCPVRNGDDRGLIDMLDNFGLVRCGVPKQGGRSTLTTSKQSPGIFSARRKQLHFKIRVIDCVGDGESTHYQRRGR